MVPFNIVCYGTKVHCPVLATHGGSFWDNPNPGLNRWTTRWSVPKYIAEINWRHESQMRVDATKGTP